MSYLHKLVCLLVACGFTNTTDLLKSKCSPGGTAQARFHNIIVTPDLLTPQIYCLVSFKTRVYSHFTPYKLYFRLVIVSRWVTENYATS